MLLMCELSFHAHINEFMMLCVVAMKLGRSALMFAAMNGHVAVVDYLLKRGAQADLVNNVSLDLLCNADTVLDLHSCCCEL